MDGYRKAHEGSREGRKPPREPGRASLLRLAGRLSGQMGQLGQTAAFGLAKAFFVGFALSLSAMGSGLAPFGLAYVATCPGDRNGGLRGTLAAAAGSFGGYTLAYGSGGLFYAAAVLICFAVRFALGGTRAGRNPYLMPLCAGGSLLCVKSVVAVQGGFMGVVVLLCESVLCAGFCLLFCAAAPQDVPGRLMERFPAGRLWGRLAMIVAGLLIFQPIRVLGDVSPARVLAAFTVMLVAWQGGSALGAGAGVALGASMDMAARTGPFFAAAYGFSGLIGGIGGRQGRFACAICHVLANCVATMWGHDHINAMPGLFECFMASVFFVMLPDSVFLRLSALLGGPETPVSRPAGQRAFAAARLSAIGTAIGELGEAMEAMLNPRRQHDDITKVYDRAAERVCRRCPTASVCWERDYVTTLGALSDVTAKLRQHNFLRESDFPAHFTGRCSHIKSFTGAVNEEYRAFLRRMAAARREDEQRALMGRQYRSLQGVVEGMAGPLSAYPEYFPALEARVRAIARAYCQPGRVSVYTLAGRMHVEITLPGEDNSLSDAEAFMRSLTAALKRRFWPPEPLCAKSGVILRISERERLSANVGCATRKKPGEHTSGDSSAHLHTDDGRAVVLLSDGMGTGSAAGTVSAKAIQLISGFVKSGCSVHEAAKAVMPVLAARVEQQGFVTLDLLEINLYTGQACLSKHGAAPSYLVRDGRVERLSGQSLPAGLAAGAEGPSPIQLRLSPGDRLVMMSDGVWDNIATEQQLAQDCCEPAAQLGSRLIAQAAAAGAVDDMSVLVITVS